MEEKFYWILKNKRNLVPPLSIPPLLYLVRTTTISNSVTRVKDGEGFVNQLNPTMKIEIADIKE